MFASFFSSCASYHKLSLESFHFFINNETYSEKWRNNLFKQACMHAQEEENKILISVLRKNK
jgi:hypothetical protein